MIYYQKKTAYPLRPNRGRQVGELVTSILDKSAQVEALEGARGCWNELGRPPMQSPSFPYRREMFDPFFFQFERESVLMPQTAGSSPSA